MQVERFVNGEGLVMGCRISCVPTAEFTLYKQTCYLLHCLVKWRVGGGGGMINFFTAVIRRY